MAAGLQSSAYSQITFVVNSNLDDANSRDADAGDNVCEDANGRCTLRAAIDEANAQTGDVTIILPGRLPMGAVGTYTLARVAPDMAANTYEDNNEFGDLDLMGSFNSLTLQGTGTPGPTITISPNDRIIHVGASASVNLRRLHLTGGTARPGDNGTGDGSGVGVDGENGDDGGALLVGVGATVNIDQVTFDGNTTQSGGNGATPASSLSRTAGGNAGNGGDGGAIYISDGATVNINRSTLYQNGTGDAGSAASGQASGEEAVGGNGGDGGSGAAIYTAGTLNIKNSTIHANTAGSPGSGGGGVNGGENGEVGEGGNGGGIATAQSVNGTLLNQGTVSIINTLIAGNTAGDDTSNGKQPGTDLYDSTIGSTFTSQGFNLIGSIGSVNNIGLLDTDQNGTDDNELDPVITGLNQNDNEAVPTLALGAGSPAIDSGTSTDSDNYDAKGFLRPAEGTADIGATEANSEPTPDDIKIVELDVNNTDGMGEFIEVKNRGAYPVQMDDYVVVAFGAQDNVSCFTANLYGELLPGELYVFADPGVSESNLEFGFDLIQENCGSAEGNQFDNESGAVALYFGDGTNFTGVTAGTMGELQKDVIVYDNSQAGRSFAVADLCSDFGLANGCAANDSGDDASIQLDDQDNITSAAPSPGIDNGDASLPVEWLAFTGQAVKNHSVDLYWSTAYEENSEGFQIERLIEGSWIETEWVNGKGDSRQGHSYELRVPVTHAGIQTFRLHQVNFDGTGSYSQIINVDIAPSQEVSIFPNPARGNLNINLPGNWEGEVNIAVIDLVGRVVTNLVTENEGERSFLLDISDIPTGGYFIRLAANGRTEVLKVQIK